MTEKNMNNINEEDLTENMINDEELEDVRGGSGSIFRRKRQSGSGRAKYKCGEVISCKHGGKTKIVRIVHVRAGENPVVYAVSELDNPTNIFYVQEKDINDTSRIPLV